MMTWNYWRWFQKECKSKRLKPDWTCSTTRRNALEPLLMNPKMSEWQLVRASQRQASWNTTPPNINMVFIGWQSFPISSVNEMMQKKVSCFEVEHRLWRQNMKWERTNETDVQCFYRDSQLNPSLYPETEESKGQLTKHLDEEGVKQESCEEREEWSDLVCSVQSEKNVRMDLSWTFLK